MRSPRMDWVRPLADNAALVPPGNLCAGAAAARRPFHLNLLT
ncbi:Uncharacterized protein pbN1_06010 [Aromatoleum bremense]|nr:Uncharacterized protein pbN1_06010 [Aromatoleum bremense]